MKCIFNQQQGGWWDISDEGSQVNEVNDRVDLWLIVKKLPPKEKKIAEMISEGYTWREIMKIMSVGQSTISNVLSRIQKSIKIV